MAIKKQACAFHFNRHAVGVCVITKQPLCAECSTRYEGVNYSKEGLRILREQRAASTRQSQKGHRTITAAGVLATPALLYTRYLFYRLSITLLVDLQQFSFLQ